MSEDKLVETPVFLGITRPAMQAGVPLDAFVLEAVGAALCMMFFMPAVLVFAPLHAALMLVTRAEPNWWNLLVAWWTTRALAWQPFWRASSYSPFNRPGSSRHGPPR
jgi:type IV secretion system protein VirB3